MTVGSRRRAAVDVGGADPEVSRLWTKLFLELDIGRRVLGRPQGGQFVFQTDYLGINVAKVGQLKRAFLVGLRVLVEPFFQVEQVLSPIKIAIEQMLVTMFGSSYQFIEVPQAVWVDLQTAGSVSREQGHYPAPPLSNGLPAGSILTCPWPPSRRETAAVYNACGG